MSVRLYQSLPFSSSCVFTEQFNSVRDVNDQNGVIIGLPTIDKKITFASPSYSSGIYYGGTKNVLCGATQASLRVAFRLPSGAVPGSYIFNKGTLVDRQWDLRVELPGQVQLGIDTAGVPHSRYGGFAIASGIIYDTVWVYNGAGATNPDRLKCYLGPDGVLQTLTFGSTIPTSMLWTSVPIGVGTLNTTSCQGVAGIEVFQVQVFVRAFSASEAADLLAGTTYSEVTP